MKLPLLTWPLMMVLVSSLSMRGYRWRPVEALSIHRRHVVVPNHTTILPKSESSSPSLTTTTITTTANPPEITTAMESSLRASPHSFRRTVLIGSSCATTLSCVLQVLACCHKKEHFYANAACLSGDTSVDCIGVYKMPLDDAAMPYVETPQVLERYAPDIRWVPPVPYPKTYAAARMELTVLQTKSIQSLEQVVFQGNLTEAGILLLEITPRVTVAGRVVMRNLYDATNASGDLSMKAYRAEVAYTEVLSRLGQCDVMIGQALSGQLGALAPAQIQILSEIREANVFLDDLVRALPEKLSSPGKKSKS